MRTATAEESLGDQIHTVDGTESSLVANRLPSTLYSMMDTPNFELDASVTFVGGQVG